LPFFLGLITTLLGADGGVHLCEETENASTSFPINRVLGFSALLAILFYISDVMAALNSLTSRPFIEILRQATSSDTGAVGMTYMIIARVLHATKSLFAAASRMLWAFARDCGAPGSRLLMRVEPRQTPYQLNPLYLHGQHPRFSHQHQLS
jgi:choline transport protein